MGNCHNNEQTLIEEADDLNPLIEENLTFIKGLSLLFLKQNKLGASVKAMKVYESCKDHYYTVKSQRVGLISIVGRLNSKIHYNLEKSIGIEWMQLRNTGYLVKKQFKALSG